MNRNAAKAIAFAALAVLVACSAADRSVDDMHATKAGSAKRAASEQSAANNSGVASAPVAPSPYDTQVKLFGEFTDRYGYRRRYVQVAPGLDDAQVVTLAGRLHAGEPDTWFWLLDDDALAQQMMKTLPKTADGDLSGYPLDWVKAHTVAQIALELMPGGGKRWVVYRGAGSDVMEVLD